MVFNKNDINGNGDCNSLIAIALFALVIAWINFINITLNHAVEYTKSFGIPKIVRWFFVLATLFLFLLEILIQISLIGFPPDR